MIYLNVGGSGGPRRKLPRIGTKEVRTNVDSLIHLMYVIALLYLVNFPTYCTSVVHLMVNKLDMTPPLDPTLSSQEDLRPKMGMHTFVNCTLLFITAETIIFWLNTIGYN